MAHERAGLVALESDLISVDAAPAVYYDLTPDPSNPDQKVTFGTSGHRDSSLDIAFNDLHIVATMQAIVEYRAAQGVHGPLFIGKDTHVPSLPAWRTAAEMLVANGVPIFAEREDEYTPTPVVFRAIIHYNREYPEQVADGIVATPSHDPLRDGGFKYNPPTGDPADTDATKWIADRANTLMASPTGARRKPYEQVTDKVTRLDYRTPYRTELAAALDLDAIAAAGVRIGADPFDGASVQYWECLAEHSPLDLTVVNPKVDPTWRFMILDTDSKIHMDYSLPNSMASLVANRDRYDIVTGNDADSDRHGTVAPGSRLINSNAFFTAAIDYLFSYRPGWAATTGVGKTLVSSSIVDKMAARLGRKLVEVPVGFKWFVPGLTDGSLGFDEEESAGAGFLDSEGRTWTTDKDGILLALLASEILTATGRSPNQHYADMESVFGTSYYVRVDVEANREQKARLIVLSPDDVRAHELTGQPITVVLTNAPGNGAPIGGIRVTTDSGWFAARPSETEDKYKIYVESLRDADHLAQIQAEVREVVDTAPQD